MGHSNAKNLPSIEDHIEILAKVTNIPEGIIRTVVFAEFGMLLGDLAVFGECTTYLGTAYLDDEDIKIKFSRQVKSLANKGHVDVNDILLEISEAVD